MTIPNPGWYPDPENGMQDRWWNGVSWSEQRKVRVADGAGLAGSGANIPAVSHITNATDVGDLPAAAAAKAQSWATGSTAYPPSAGYRIPDDHSPSTGTATGTGAARRSADPAMRGLVLSLGSLVFNPYGILGILGVVFSAVGLARSGHPLSSGVGVARNAVAIAGLVIGGLVTVVHAFRFLSGLG
ncbi:DUF2510 domain-containing protein [Cryobacterium tagatosivorans]|uniref:DUF2510 domain-containing protein n=1 Tax=Cryobacterium tagatosivorans TaxID=1259199 RepID=A0A4R8UAE5_9MICO|nr:DUF2510 domain-containing protein [Cryobacterium tagatosivorans]TFB47000.1 DUF2510 domain-containing protein [Cryobacterium tagatosivorans]